MEQIDLTTNKVFSKKDFTGSSKLSKIKIDRLFNTEGMNPLDRFRVMIRIDSTISRYSDKFLFLDRRYIRYFQSCDCCGKEFKYSNRIWWKTMCLCSDCEVKLDFKGGKPVDSVLYRYRGNDRYELNKAHSDIMRKIMLSY